MWLDPKSVLKFVIWLISLKIFTYVFDHYLFPIVRPGDKINTMLDKLQKYYKFDYSNVELSGEFIQLNPDTETKLFLEHCKTLQSKFFAYLGQCLVYANLRSIFTLTSLHAMMDRGHMMVLSESQFSTLFRHRKFKRVIDLGAGDGKVSEKLANALSLPFSELKVTDTQSQIRKRLKQRGFSIQDTDNWHVGQKFDLISMMNLLDRCEKPKTMLRQAHASLDTDGRLLVASVVPFRQSVEWRRNRIADEYFSTNRSTSWEAQCEQVAKELVEVEGFQLEYYSKVPYLSEGDVKKPFYVLPNGA